MAGDLWFFDRVAPLYDRLMWRADPAPLERALATADRPVERVLDLAGGPGRVLDALDLPASVLVDASRPMLAGAAGKGHAAVLGDAGRLPLADASVDAVLVVDALHHLPDRPAALAEAARVLRPGGVLVVREFDPGTVRGGAIALGERAARMDSSFWRAEHCAEAVTEAGLDGEVLEPGWTYTVVGTHPDDSI
jgi:ubiquinone/menaquinone biosynthesis C-methylase UbiE